MYVYFSSRGHRPRKAPYGGTGCAELGVSIYDLIIQFYWNRRGSVVRDAKLDFPVKRIFCKTR
jgi:hypothetical protein